MDVLDIRPAEPPRHRLRGPREYRCGAVEPVSLAFDEVQLGAGPRSMQVPRCDRWGAQVVAALDQDRRQTGQGGDTGDQLAFAQEGPVSRVVALDPRERQREPWLGKQVLDERVGRRQHACRLPPRPGQGHCDPSLRTARLQPSPVAGHEVVALLRRDGGDELLPPLWQKVVRAVPVDPVELAGPERGDAAQDHRQHPVGVSLGVGQRQRGPPGRTGQDPSVDPQLAPQPLHVGDQVPRRVGLQADIRIARVRRAATGAPLIEQHHAIGRRVIGMAHRGQAAAARPPVHHQHGYAVWIAELAPPDPLPVTDVEQSLSIGRRVAHLLHAPSNASRAAGRSGASREGSRGSGLTSAPTSEPQDGSPSVSNL